MARFGDIAAYRSATAVINERLRGRQRREAVLQALARELLLAARSLGRHRGFTTISALTLALGLGGTIAIFTLLQCCPRCAPKCRTSIPGSRWRTCARWRRRSAATARTRFVMSLLAVAAAMALTLSTVGMFGVISQVVGERRYEIGVRMALGARAGQVRSMVVRESLILAAAGVTLGLAGSLAVTRLLRALLHGVSPTDPLTLGVVAATLLAVATAASFLPAWRASRIDPSETLRGD